MQTERRNSYRARINSVIDYIDTHLAEPLDFQKLSSVAHFSPWHFHRLFQALTGETLAERVRRRRLETAAGKLLVSPPETALSIGLEVGFGSAEVFTRAFKSHFGVTPSAWRQGAFAQWAKERRLQLASIHQNVHTTRQALDAAFREQARARFKSLTPAAGEHAASVALKTFPDTRVAYMRRIGPYGDPGIGRLWQTFATWCGKRGLLRGREILGVSHDSPDVTAPDKCRYDACVSVDDDFKPQGEVGVQVVKGGLYACVGFQNTAAHIFQTRPALEAYGAQIEVDPDSGVFKCDLCLPVRPL
jgi:AraC family transcriptional regulator